MNTFFSIISFCFLCSNIIAQPQAYKLYNQKGKEIAYSKMLKELQNADIVFFGELHNNPICHWLQLEVTRDLYAQENDNLLLGAEMFESDNQLLINEFFLGCISEKNFENETRLWSNYKTDYKPLVSFAKDNNLRFVATNIPRRYASSVFKNGLKKLDNLPKYSKVFIAPLPIIEDYELGCYKEMLEMHTHGMTSNPKYYPQAQMIKDATMAYFIYGNWSEGDLFLHFNGTFHSNNKEGIVWYLRQFNPNLKILVITTVEQEEVIKLDKEHYRKGDYIIAVPERMGKTY
ncbi:MAG: ChaN family lipoprotein [Saprospiraceae bacterium]|nr:ChaN family lipoprotein [Saprospiraceae bacterium]